MSEDNVEFLGMPNDELIDYAVCPKCNNIYKLSESKNGKKYIADCV